MQIPEPLWAEYRALFARLVKVSRELKIAASECDAFVQRLMLEHDVPAGHAFDLHGDGAVKPKDQCKPLPQVT